MAERDLIKLPTERIPEEGLDALKAPIDKLMLFVRAQHKHPDFLTASNDVMQISRAKFFPKNVPNRMEIIARFKNFLESIEGNQLALNNLAEVIKDIKLQ